MAYHATWIVDRILLAQDCRSRETGRTAASRNYRSKMDCLDEVLAGFNPMRDTDYIDFLGTERPSHGKKAG